MPTDSQPGAKRFLNYLILILILIFITVFLYSTEQISQQAEQVHIEKTINEMNAAMALTLYEFVVNNQVQELERFNRGNPFVFLAAKKMLPANYRGEVNNLSYATSKGAWYYLRDSEQVVYRLRDGRQERRFHLLLKYNDRNANGRFDGKVDTIRSFQVEASGPDGQ